MHDLVLVRRAELACRNSWDQDLWEPSPVQRKTSGAPEVDRNRVPRPATLDNPTDRVTSIDIARPSEPSLREAAKPRHPAVAGGQGSPVRVPLDEDEPSSASETAENGGVSSLEPSFQRALFTRPNAVQNRIREGGSGGTRVVVADSPRKPDNPPVPPKLRTSPKPGHSAVTINDTSPLPVNAVNEALQDHSRPIVEPTTSRSRHQGAATPSSTDEPVVHIDGLQVEARAAVEAFAPPDREDVEARKGVSPLDQAPWVAAIPRCCDTCREFQRDPDGRTGYCGSPYAMGKRTMVKSDQLACRSSIGVWWLPSDDTWLDRADISHHTRPTPYLDAVLDDLRPESR
ncbi:MAG: hypothetical protein R3A46_04785 [Thermomicrobiales bacterium]